jgi:hypothetical protein
MCQTGFLPGAGRRSGQDRDAAPGRCEFSARAPGEGDLAIVHGHHHGGVHQTGGLDGGGGVHGGQSPGGQQGDIDREVLHFGDEVGVAGVVDLQTIDRKHVPQPVLVPGMHGLAQVVGPNGCHRDRPHDLGFPGGQGIGGQSLVGSGRLDRRGNDDPRSFLEQGTDHGGVEVVGMGVGDQHHVDLGPRRGGGERIDGKHEAALGFDAEGRLGDPGQVVLGPSLGFGSGHGGHLQGLPSNYPKTGGGATPLHPCGGKARFFFLVSVLVSAEVLGNGCFRGESANPCERNSS